MLAGLRGPFLNSALWPGCARVLVLGSYPPRQCGIATFTKDVVDSLSQRSDVSCEVIAIDEPTGESRVYEKSVIARMIRDDPASYADVAALINASAADVLLVQHEYGLFGGQDGAMFVDLLEQIRKPVVIILHTVLSQPSSHHREIAIRICNRAEAVVVLSRTGKDILTRVYGIEATKVPVIPHGVPDVPRVATGSAKTRLHITDRLVISTFGLLSRGKGIEFAIKAMPSIVASHPEALYLVLGQTHPAVREHEGESYRTSLQALVVALGMQRNVAFVDSYLGLSDLLEYLAATDVYLTPYLNADQIVSGTLAYAVGCGKAIVSTPYLYAQELLANDRGILCTFRDPQSIAASILRVLDDPERRNAMERETHRYGRQMTWLHVANAYSQIVQDLAAKTVHMKGRPAVARAAEHRSLMLLPAIANSSANSVNHVSGRA
jgi:glycosyltransferase involved in cell wall biosynthesis